MYVKCYHKWHSDSVVTQYSSTHSVIHLYKQEGFTSEVSLLLIEMINGIMKSSGQLSCCTYKL